MQPPTLLAQRGAGKEFAPLVETYATVPYADVNPSILAGLAYVVMFGMMFADVGHGALLLMAAVAVRLGWWSSRLGRLRPVWLFLAGAGAASMVFGALYGEFFGPTGVIPVIWLEPLEHPVELLGAAVGVGAVLLAGAYALGTVNRFREGGWRAAVYAPTGIAGSAVFLGLGAVVGGVIAGWGWLDRSRRRPRRPSAWPSRPSASTPPPAAAAPGSPRPRWSCSTSSSGSGPTSSASPGSPPSA